MTEFNHMKMFKINRLLISKYFNTYCIVYNKESWRLMFKVERGKLVEDLGMIPLVEHLGSRNGAIRKKFRLKKPRWENYIDNKVLILRNYTVSRGSSYFPIGGHSVTNETCYLTHCGWGSKILKLS